MSEDAKVTAAEALAAIQGNVISADTVYASVFHINTNSNEFQILFGHNALVMTPGIAPSVPAVIVQLSPQSVKDLCLLLQKNIATYEGEWGEIQTQFTRSESQGADK